MYEIAAPAVVPVVDCVTRDFRGAEGLLDARQLLLGIAGHCPGGSPLIGWVRELAELHTSLLTTSVSAAQDAAGLSATEIRIRIGTILSLIDDWSVLHLPRPSAGRRHTHSLGEVIGHVTGAYAQMQWIMRHSDSAEHHDQAALRMTQVQQGYQDLVVDIRALRVELPLGWRGPQLGGF